MEIGDTVTIKKFPEIPEMVGQEGKLMAKLNPQVSTYSLLVKIENVWFGFQEDEVE